MMKDVMTTLIRNESTYTDTEKRIASFILNSGRSVSGMSSVELGQKAGVSQSAIIKFVKKLGFEGFMDFRVRLSESYGRDEHITPLKHDDISLEDPMGDVAKAIVSESVTALLKSYENMDFATIEKSIELINTSKRIFLCGKGSSALPAQDFAGKLMKLGLTVLWYQDLETMETASLMVNQADVFISFSFSGETKIITRILENVKRGGAKTVVITKNSNSSHGRLADVVIEIYSNETILRTAAMSSRIAFFSVVDILFLGVVKGNLEERLSMIRDVYEKLRK